MRVSERPCRLFELFSHRGLNQDQLSTHFQCLGSQAQEQESNLARLTTHQAARYNLASEH